MFSPTIGQEIIINGIKYTFLEHPSAPGIPFGISGRRATVYQLAGKPENKALKVFYSKFREPRLFSVAEHLSPYASIQGLKACNRLVISGHQHKDLIKVYPDLDYAVLMPWIEGKTWGEILFASDALSKQGSLNYVSKLTQTLTTMEQQGIAHCDLSGANLILSADNQIELIDLEEMYGTEFKKPKDLPAGSSGYAHHTVMNGNWSEESDRFSGAVLIAEMLGWISPRVKKVCWGESFFEPNEVQKDCERYTILKEELSNLWG